MLTKPLGRRTSPRAGALLLAFAALLTLLPGFALSAQPSNSAPSPAQPERMLTAAEIKARYRHCPNGYYSGPQAGKAGYTKDLFMWAVTPAFAAKFCMPQEFISTELRGAEAVAYRLVEDETEQHCGLGGKAEVCMKPRYHRFEIYYPTGLLPKLRDAPYFSAAKLPSALLLSSTDKESSFASRSVRQKPRTGALGVIEGLGLDAVSKGRVSLPLGAFYTQQYYQEVFEGLDYLAVEGATGFTRHPGWKSDGTREFALTMTRPGDRNPVSNMRLRDLQMVAPLPARMSDVIIKNDNLGGNDIVGLAKKALSK